MATEAMYADCGLSFGDWIAFTSVIRPPDPTSRTWTGPKKLGTLWPVKVPFLRPVATDVGVGAGDPPPDGGAPEGAGVGVAPDTEDELTGGGATAIPSELGGGVRK